MYCVRFIKGELRDETVEECFEQASFSLRSTRSIRIGFLHSLEEEVWEMT